jgi:hypothetical protein
LPHNPTNAAWLSPRIWRDPASDFYGDEPLHAAAVYTDPVLRNIRSHGFDGVWLRGRLRELIRSTVLPELNDAAMRKRIESLRTVIQRGRQAGLGVWLYFNEPLAMASDDAFWNRHADIAGQPWEDWTEHRKVTALCTSTETVRRFMAEATGQVFTSLPGLAGIILITASEYHTHCWSHYRRFNLNDGAPGAPPAMRCPRCARREPADVVAELIDLWRRAAGQVQPRPRILAWNWSWSMWYADPQGEIISRLHPPVELLADWERGGTTTWRNAPLLIDEYSLRYVGPSERFLGSQRAAGHASLPIHAKLQIGATHEIATVPNLPLIGNLHRKLVRLHEHNIAGVMATWNFGCSLTLNSFAFGLFCADPVLYHDYATFTAELARQYFGAVDVSRLRQAWRHFAEAFEHHPFSIHFLYWSPLNYAPAVALGPYYRGQPLGPAWLVHELGDRFEDCLGDFSLSQVIESFEAMGRQWARGVVEYRAALSGSATGHHQAHCAEELSTAAMIASQLQSFLNLAKFHRWRLDQLAAVRGTPPCHLPLDAVARQIIADECQNAAVALQLVRADSRLGWHQECHAYFYDPQTIENKLTSMRVAIQ